MWLLFLGFFSKGAVQFKLSNTVYNEGQSLSKTSIYKLQTVFLKFHFYPMFGAIINIFLIYKLIFRGTKLLV